MSFLFLIMLQQPTIRVPTPDNFTYTFIFKCCARLKLTRQGKQLQRLITKMGFGSDLYIQNALIHMCSEFVNLGIARYMFEKMPDTDVVSWTSMIDGLGNDDRPIEAIKLFERISETGVELNDATAISVLRACADSGALSMGRKGHRIVKERGINSKANVSTVLIDMYANSG